MKIGIFLGSFDPPHVGHLHLAVSCLNRDLVDKVIFVPTVQNPEKSKSTEFEHRYNMLNLYIEGRMEVSDIETKLEAPYYSYKTIRAIKEKYPNDELYLIVGDDVNINNWENGQEILDTVKIIMFERFGSPRMDYEYFIHPAFSISSTEVRELLNECKLTAPYLSLAVRTYIYIHNLYRNE